MRLRSFNTIWPHAPGSSPDVPTFQEWSYRIQLGGSERVEETHHTQPECERGIDPCHSKSSEGRKRLRAPRPVAFRPCLPVAFEAVEQAPSAVGWVGAARSPINITESIAEVDGWKRWIGFSLNRATQNHVGRCWQGFPGDDRAQKLWPDERMCVFLALACSSPVQYNILTGQKIRQKSRAEGKQLRVYDLLRYLFPLLQR